MASQSEAVHSFRLHQASDAARHYAPLQTHYDPGQMHLQPEYTRQDKLNRSNASYNYRPVAIKTWFLIASAAFFAACVAVTEYAIRSEPTATNVYENDTLTARDDMSSLVPGPISQSRRLSPKGMPQIDREETLVLYARAPDPTAYLSLGPSIISNYQSMRPSSRSTTLFSSETITTESVVKLTVTESASASGPVSTSRSPVGSLIVLTKETSTTIIPVPTHAPTSAPNSGSIVIIPAVVSTSSEQRRDPSGNPTTILHITTLQPEKTSTVFLEAPSDNEGHYTYSTESATTPFPPIVTTFTSTIALSNLESSTIIIPEVLSMYTETTHDLAGSERTIFHTSTLQTARTTTEVFDGTLLITQSFVTTVITTTIGDTGPHPQATFIGETLTIPATTTRVREVTTDSLGKIITRLVDSSVPAQTITTEIISTLSEYDPGRSKILGFESQQQRLVGSSAAAPTVRVLLSTFEYTTVIPTSIPTFAPVPPNGFNGTELEILGLTKAEYFSGEFLPTILAVIASLLIEGISNNAKRMQPFLTLASSKTGATAESSILLSFDKWFGAMIIPHAIRLNQPLIIITQIAVIGSQIIAPLSAEAVQIYTPNSCTASCFGKIAVQVPVARALEAVLGVTAALLGLIAIITNLKSFKTGVNHNPWSVAGMASLCGHSDVRKLLAKLPRGAERVVDETSIAKVLAGHRYMLGNFSPVPGTPCSEPRYGLTLNHASEDSNSLYQNPYMLLEDTEKASLSDHIARKGGAIGTKVSPWLRPLTWWFRSGFVAIIAAVLVIVVYYQQTTGDSRFERFMDSRGFGVRFLFTGLGVLIGGLMGAIFECKSTKFLPRMVVDVLSLTIHRYYRRCTYYTIPPVVSTITASRPLYSALYTYQCPFGNGFCLLPTKSPSRHCILDDSTCKNCSPSHSRPGSICLQFDLAITSNLCLAQYLDSSPYCSCSGWLISC